MSVYFTNFPTIEYDMFNDTHTMTMTDIFRTVRLKANIKEDVLLYHKYTIQDGQRPDHLSLKLYGSPDYYWTFFMVNENLVNYYNDWPLSRKEFEDMIATRYDGYVLTTNQDISTVFTKGEIVRGLVSGATGTIISKDANTNTIRLSNITGEFVANEIIRGDISGSVITITGQTEFYNATKYYVDGNGNVVDKHAIVALPVTYYEYEKDLNDSKAEIRVIRPAYIIRIADEFFKQINPTREQ